MSKRKGLNAFQMEFLTKAFGPPFWARMVPDDVVVIEGYGTFYTVNMPDYNSVVVFSDVTLASAFIEATEEQGWRPLEITRDALRDLVLRDMPLVDALMLLDIPESPVLQVIRWISG